MLHLLHLSPLILIATTYKHIFVCAQQPPPQALGDVLHLVLDKDKNSKVTISEVNSQLSMIETLFQHSDEGDEGAEEYRRLLQGVKKAAPKIFELLDSNQDGGLSKDELSYVTKFEKSLKKDGGMKNLIRDMFEILDSNNDNKLSVDEIIEGCNSDKVISDVTQKFHILFPIRKTSTELEVFVKSTIEESFKGRSNTLDKESVSKGIKWIDFDADGYLQRKEVGMAYNVAGKKFFDISKTIKQMGPMMAMFGDMNSGGVKMDL